MRFQLIGVNHKTAPVEVRERLAIPESRLPEPCKKLAEHPGIEEAMILSTCNRVEILANTKNGAGADLRGFIQSYAQLDQLVTRAFAVAKRVRTETAVGSSSVSIASVAVELAKKIFGNLHGKQVYL